MTFQVLRTIIYSEHATVSRTCVYVFRWLKTQELQIICNWEMLQNTLKDVQIRLQIRQCFVGKPLPSCTLKRFRVLHVTSNEEKNCNWYVLISFFKEVQGNASWNEQKKSGDAYRQSDKRIEFIVISVLLYPRQVHKCTGVCTIDTAKNKWIPSIVKCQNALHQNALRS